MTEEYAKIEMDLAFGSAKSYGSSRSIVRRIATNLPLKPCPRVHFQLHPYSEEASVLSSFNRPNGLVASLADVGWIDRDEDEESNCAVRSRSRASLGLIFRGRQHQPISRPLTRQRSLPSLHQGDPDPQGPTLVNDQAIQKISALEMELAKLRAQIAQIVLAQEQNPQPGLAPGVPPPPPACAPPPPPPPPPPPGPGLLRSFSAIDLIKERRGMRPAVVDTGPKQPEVPNMLDVLKDIGKVKLRAVKSRPEDSNTKAKSREPLDAASLIAEALKRKFAHCQQHKREEDSDHSGWSPEGKSHISPVIPRALKHKLTNLYHQAGQGDKSMNVTSPVEKPRPVAPLFGQHMLKSTGKRKIL